MTVPITIFCIIFLPETNQWIVSQKESQKSISNPPPFNDDEKNSKPDLTVEEQTTNSSKEADPNYASSTHSIEFTGKSMEVQHGKEFFDELGEDTLTGSNFDDVVEESRMMMPWEPLGYFFDPNLTCIYCFGSIVFAGMFASLTVMPFYLGSAPYNLNEAIIGVCYVPAGVVMFIAAQLGGASSDYSAYFQRPNAVAWYIPLYCQSLRRPVCLGTG